MSALQYCAAVIAGRARRATDGSVGLGTQKPRSRAVNLGFRVCALGGIRTPNLLIRSQMLYPLSYERTPLTGTDEG
jgi:hypothetical protein